MENEDTTHVCLWKDTIINEVDAEMDIMIPNQSPLIEVAFKFESQREGIHNGDKGLRV